ncbi:hypothetical protein V1512DRAFT_249016 [Lipomyces arxii]|uniref:uncharacterized protein n=1 Tax=Lipomyces arxii TaxID=56418 RepID=UPI0034CD2ACD
MTWGHEDINNYAKMTVDNNLSISNIVDPIVLPYDIELVTGSNVLWKYTVIGSDIVHDIIAPTFEVDGSDLMALVTAWTSITKKTLSNGVVEVIATGKCTTESLQLQIYFRVAHGSPIVRFHYLISGQGSLTKTSGSDNLIYVSLTLSKSTVAKEVRLSEYLEPVHSYTLTEQALDSRHFRDKRPVMGPILTATENGESIVVAYEHGSQLPDAFIRYDLASDGKCNMYAVKGNYLSGTDLAKTPFSTIWCHFGGVKGTEDDLSEQYRTFILRYMSITPATRTPYIFYNTWNFQERDASWRDLHCTANIRLEHILADIDVAYKMGIEVYVIDVGWYKITGDWDPDPARFPDGFKEVKAKLDKYGMKFGLWFEPRTVAVTSEVFRENSDCIVSWGGKRGAAEAIYGSDASHQLCLVSSWADSFADKLIQCAKKYGVTYFKWDAITQYGCSDAGHFHGNDSNSERERADYYAFQIGLYMVKIVEKLCAACPEAIVDFDITEPSRFVGLSFLSAGKFFLINNGPYSIHYDLPNPPRLREDSLTERNGNLTFYPGPARTWMCRTPLTYDKWIPSVLFLTHYYPDDVIIEDKHGLKDLDRYIAPTGDDTIDEVIDTGADYQKINIGSLILGQNGIWGDLLSVTETGVKRFHDYLEKYKAIRYDITASQMIRVGNVGGNPEVYEKINPETGKGVVVVFSSSFGRPLSAKLKGRYSYITKHKVDPTYWHCPYGVKVSIDEEGCAVIDTLFNDVTARVVFFGAT